jgi:SRSO17 transposase
VPGWAASVTDMAPRLGPDVARAATRQRVLTDRRGRLSPAERQPSWPMAEVTGETTPAGVQSVWGRADGAAAAGRDARRVDRRPPRGAPHAVMGLDETGGRNHGRSSAGVARPYRGTAGTVEPCQLGVGVASASRRGEALWERARSA